MAKHVLMVSFPVWLDRRFGGPLTFGAAKLARHQHKSHGIPAHFLCLSSNNHTGSEAAAELQRVAIPGHCESYASDAGDYESDVFTLL